MNNKDTLGDRIKAYEAATTSRKVHRGQPFCIRLDGKAFHTWTRGLSRPYDERLSKLMVEATQDLVEWSSAKVGYTQSDEINLGFFTPCDESATQLFFGGRLQKLESLAASRLTAFFNSRVPGLLPEKTGKLALFDARAFVVPNLQELYHVFLWRQQDATKNAISMAAQALYSHKELHGKSGDEKQEMMFQKGVNFNDYPYGFKRGTFVQRVVKQVELTPQQLARMKSELRPTGAVERSFYEAQDIWLSKIDNPVGRLFEVKAWMDSVAELQRLHSQEAAFVEEARHGLPVS